MAREKWNGDDHDRADDRRARADAGALPRRGGLRRARRRPRLLRGVRRGEPTVLLLPTWSIIHSRHWKSADPLSRPPLPRRHVRRPRQRPLRSPRHDRGLRRARVRRRRARRDGRDRRPSAPSSSGLSRRRPVGRSARRRAPGARRRRGVHRAGRAVRAAPEPRGPARSTSRSSATRAGPSTTSTTGSRTTGASSSSSSARCFTEPHSTKQIEDCVGWGLDTAPETLALTVPRPRAARP